MLNRKLPSVIALNGPMHSGKSWLVAYLLRTIPDSIVMRPSDELYKIMQEEGLVPLLLSYQDFKKRSDARARLIKRATELRSEDVHVFNKRVTASEEYNSARVVIIDNIGFPDELEWYDRESEAMLLLRLDAPYNELEPLKSQARRLRTQWPNDSRVPVFYHSQVTTYDSLQMTLFLDWLQRPLTREEAGPYHGIKQLWDRYFAASESHSGSDGLSGVARFVG